MSGRLRSDRGAGMVLGVVIMFASTFLGLIWLAGTVDRGISNQSAATAIAFQAARSGAQAAGVDGLRVGDGEALDPSLARAAANATAAALFDSYGIAGSVTSIGVDQADSTVTVTVTITEGTKTVTGRGSAEAIEVT